MIVPAVIAGIGIAYWFLAYEEAGATLLLVFAAAMAIFIWVLGPTADHVGPTAPVEDDWSPRG